MIKYEKIGNEKAKQMASEQWNKQTRKQVLTNEHGPTSDERTSEEKNDEKG